METFYISRFASTKRVRIDDVSILPCKISEIFNIDLKDYIVQEFDEEGQYMWI